jgi:cytidine deaminase
MSRFAPQINLALAEARAALGRGEVPVGAVVTSSAGVLLARASNRTREWRDPTAHAEMLAIRAACAALGSERLVGCTITVTLEPCAMCAAAISAARIARLLYGAADPKSGGIEQGAQIFKHPQVHHRPEIVAGIAEAECATLLSEFFAHLR